MSNIEILSTSKYYLEITLSGSNQTIDGHFMECSGFKRTVDTIEITEVTPQMWGKNGSTKGRVVRTKILFSSRGCVFPLRCGTGWRKWKQEIGQLSREMAI